MAVRYTTLEAFTGEFVGALKSSSVESFKRRYRDTDILLIDDVQFLEGKAKIEEEFFHTFNALYETGSQLVVTCDRMPGDMNALADRLRERFESGLVADLRPPDLATRMTILRKRVASRRPRLDDPDAIVPIAERVTTNVRALAGRADPRRRLPLADRPARSTDRSSTHVLDGLYPDGIAPGPRTVEEIQAATCERLGITREALSSPDRSARVAWARQVAMYLSRELTDATLPAIGRAFGGRNHSTVLHACRRTTERIAQTPMPTSSSAAHRRASTAQCRPLRLRDFLRSCPQSVCADPPRLPSAIRRACAHIHVPYDNDPPQDRVLIVKFSVARDELLAQLQTVSRVASTRSAIQALSGVQILAGAERRGAARHRHGGRPARPARGRGRARGRVVLPARLLLDVVRSLSGPTVTIELRAAEQDVELVAGNATFHIRTLRSEDFPPFPEPEQDGAVRVPAGAFVETILKVASSASRDETRPVLTGILVSASERELRMVATDSYRLSVKETQLEQPLQQAFEANVPARALQELARLVQQARRRGAHRRRPPEPGRLPIAGVVLSSRLIEGQFPNYRQLLPETYEHELTPGRRRARPTSCAASACWRRRTRRCGCRFQPGELTVSAQTPDIGEARESLPVAFQGEPLEIGFNPEFLRDGLEGIESGNIVLKLISPLRPGLIEAGDDAGFLYLIMPIRLNV